MPAIDPRTGLPLRSGPQPPRNVLGGWSPSGPQRDTPFTGPSALGGGLQPSPFANIPGFAPDYKSLIGGDPIFGQLKNDLSAQGISDAAARAAATQRAIAQFGVVPDLNQLGGLNQGFLNADITPEARALAQRNTESGMSIAARQKEQFDKNLRAIKNALAARGALRSGEAGYQLGEAQKEFDIARFDTTQELVDYLAGVQAGFAQAERARQMQASQGAEAAMMRQIQLNPAQPAQQAGAPSPVSGVAPQPPAAAPAGSAQTYTGVPVNAGFTASPEDLKRRQLLEGLLF